MSIRDFFDKIKSTAKMSYQGKFIRYIDYIAGGWTNQDFYLIIASDYEYIKFDLMFDLKQKVIYLPIPYDNNDSIRFFDSVILTLYNEYKIEELFENKVIYNIISNWFDMMEDLIKYGK